MIWYYLILFITTLFTEVFSWLPKITTIPSIIGVDIDGQLTSGMSLFYTFIHTFWPIGDVFYGLIALLIYYAIKMSVKFFLGHRTT